MPVRLKESKSESAPSHSQYVSHSCCSRSCTSQIRRSWRRALIRLTTRSEKASSISKTSQYRGDGRGRDRRVCHNDKRSEGVQRLGDTLHGLLPVRTRREIGAPR